MTGPKLLKGVAGKEQVTLLRGRGVAIIIIKKSEISNDKKNLQ